MKTRTAWLCLSALTLMACGDKEGSDTGADATFDLATELWGATSGYESWGQVEPWTGIQVSSDGTHGTYVDIYLNAEAEGSFSDADAAEGSIFVKKGHDAADGSAPKGTITVMWKNADAGTSDGWFWARYTDDGAIELSGSPDSCTGCHSSGDDMRRMVSDVPGTE